jgi:hypothetical protein
MEMFEREGGEVFKEQKTIRKKEMDVYNIPCMHICKLILSILSSLPMRYHVQTCVVFRYCPAAMDQNNCKSPGRITGKPKFSKLHISTGFFSPILTFLLFIRSLLYQALCRSYCLQSLR